MEFLTSLFLFFFSLVAAKHEEIRKKIKGKRNEKEFSRSFITMAQITTHLALRPPFKRLTTSCSMSTKTP